MMSDPPKFPDPDPAAEFAVSIDGERRAPRVAVPQGVFIDVDGEPALLVDFSLVGAQLATTGRMHPDQRVQLLLPGSDVLIVAKVTRSSLEAGHQPGTTQCRVGIEYEEPEDVRSVLERFQAELASASDAKPRRPV